MGRTATACRGDPRTKLYSQIEELDKRIEDEGMAFRPSCAPDWPDEHRKEASARRSRLRGEAGRCSPNRPVEPKVSIDQARALRSAIGQSQWATITQARYWLSPYGGSSHSHRPTSEEMVKSTILEIAHEAGAPVRGDEGGSRRTLSWPSSREYKRSHHGPCGHPDRGGF